MSIPIRCGLAGIVSVFLTIAASSGLGQTIQEFRIDTAASKIVVDVGRSGLFAFAGHDHEVAVSAFTGRLMLDRTDVTRSKLSVQFDASAMTVTGRGEPPEDVLEVQRVMLSDRVLDVERYPRINFVSRRISLVELEPSPDRMKLRIDGELTLRGVARPIIVPIDVRLSADRLTVTGKVRVRQTLFGIRPVTAGAGTVRVKDEVEVVFTVVAQRVK
jgi:polyisoprenoid-binding protein YceI